MPKREVHPPVNISLRKARIFSRHEECERLREQGISPFDRAHDLLKEVDPDLLSLTKLKRELMQKD